MKENSHYLNKPELLSPAGDWDCIKAAVACGADAVYFGLDVGFNARARAANFKLEDLGKLVDYLHARGVRGYLALNTLVFTNELKAVGAILKRVEVCGVDAIIVQDIGVCLLAKYFAPNVDVHASTQMTVTSPEGVAVIKELGVAQIVLARELSIAEIDKFREVEVPLEVFVHGALCVAYSGQCLTSEALGRRSANRGECAQACRLPYELWVDGEAKDLGARQYLLSPQDLAGIEYILNLIQAGVKKGRLKSAEYVAAITGAYRRAIDQAWENLTRNQQDGSTGFLHDVVHKATIDYEMEMMFSRGLYSGWLNGVNHQKLVHGLYSNKRGTYLGEVIEVRDNRLRLKECRVVLNRGDGVLFDNGGEQNDLVGGRVYDLKDDWIVFEKSVLKLANVKVGDGLFKTDDPYLRAAIANRYRKDKECTRMPLRIIFEVGAGEHSRLVAWVSGYEDAKVEVVSRIKAELARNRALDEDVIKGQLSRLRDTYFELERINCKVKKKAMLPLSELNHMRRRMVESLYKIKAPRDWRDWFWRYSSREDKKEIINNIGVRTINVVNKIAENGIDWHESQNEDCEILASVLCRTQEQAGQALSMGWKRIYLDFEDIRQYRHIVSFLKQKFQGQGEIYLATPRVQKPNEQAFCRIILEAGADGVLVRNLGALAYFNERDVPVVGDFSLNVANPWSARWFRTWGLKYLTASYDLTAEQIIDLARHLPIGSIEVTLHQHIPMFHMEHCVFAAFLSTGRDYRDCGRPCERHSVEIKDRVGMLHPVVADVGCRNTVFHGKAQSGAAYYHDFCRAGIRYFRIELLKEDAFETSRILATYDALIKGQLSGESLIKKIGAIDRLGVTGGTFDC